MTVSTLSKQAGRRYAQMRNVGYVLLAAMLSVLTGGATPVTPTASNAHINNRMQSYLKGTAYAGTASSTLSTNLSRWLRDGSQVTSGSANARWMALIRLARA